MCAEVCVLWVCRDGVGRVLVTVVTSILRSGVTSLESDDTIDLSQVTQMNVNIKDTNIRSAKRTFSQATLPDGYWTKRPRKDSRSS